MLGLTLVHNFKETLPVVQFSVIAEKKWFVVFFEVEPSDDGGRSRHRLVAKHSPRLRPSHRLRLSPIVIAKLISYV